MNAAVDYYAELLANLLGWFSDSAVAGNRVVADGFVLEVDVECTALLVTAVVAGSVAILSPGDRKTKIITVTAGIRWPMDRNRVARSEGLPRRTSSATS